MTHPSWEQRLEGIYSTLSDELDYSDTDCQQFQQSAASSSNEECQEVVKKRKEFCSWISPVRSTSSQQKNTNTSSSTTHPKLQGGTLVTTIVNSAKTIGGKARSFVLSTPDKTKRNDKIADEVTPVMLYADADIITSMEQVDHVDPFSFLGEPIQLFPSKDGTTTITPTTSDNNASFSLLSLKSIDQKNELVVFNSTIFTTNKSLERSHSFCKSPLPFQYNDNIEDATVKVTNFITAKEGTTINVKELSSTSSSSSVSSSSSSSSGDDSFYSFSSLSWDGFAPNQPQSTAEMSRRSKHDKHVLSWKENDEF